MSGFTSKDIRTIVLKSVHPSLLDFHFSFEWYFLKELHSFSVRIVSKIMKGIFIGFKSLNPIIFNKLKKEKHHTCYNGTLYSLALISTHLSLNQNFAQFIIISIFLSQSICHRLRAFLGKCYKDILDHIFWRNSTPLVWG